MSINLFDLIFAVILLIFFLLSYLRGAVKELFSLLGLAGGFLAANWWAAPFADRLDPLLPDQNSAELLAFVLIMVMGYFVGAFFGGVSDFFRNAPAGALSRLLGGIVGLGKGWTISLALYWVVLTYIPVFQDELAESWIGTWLAGTVDTLERMNLM